MNNKWLNYIILSWKKLDWDLEDELGWIFEDDALGNWVDATHSDGED